MRTLILAFALLLPTFAFAGNEMGNGTDNFTREHGSMWFVDPARTATYCISVSPEFKADIQTLRAIVRTSFDNWIGYFERHKKASRPKDLSPTTSFLEVASCDAKADIEFLFGVDTAEVKKAREHYFNPTAMAERVTFNEVSGWSKGFVW
ncbi:MAG TPA: hypothetical protein VM432_12865, partial [Bdellovibrionales bacterium]|nr:hypothetical protein [Bdellovibrionales bacterium]